MEAHQRHGFPVTIVRPSFTYGDTWIPTAFGIDFTSVHRMRRGLPLPVHGDGTSLWVMTHASDFAKGLLGLCGRRDALGEAFHITSDEVLTWNQVYECIAAAAGAQPRLIHIPSDFIAKVDPAIGAGLLGDKAHSLVFDNSKIKRFVPEFRCTVPLAEGMRRTVAWLDAHPAEQRLDSNAAVEKILAAWAQLRPVGGNVDDLLARTRAVVVVAVLGPSSHSSGPLTTPSPQWGPSLHCGVQPPYELSRMPSSHSSGPFLMPSPQWGA